jgi:hypothetical protein
MPFQQNLQRFTQNKHFPILLLLAVNLIIGLFTFQDYGFSLDEPLFYRYADAIGYAYSPAEWFSGDFDLVRAYGPSAGDHANRGPVYILIARLPAHLLQSLGLDVASSWHLVNFLTFQIGLYFFYIFCLRWMRPWAAFGATALMSAQPILWEHAFINPKDPPFLVFFLITLELGFRMAEKLANARPDETKWQTFKHILLPAILLGLTTNIRVLGPLVAVLAGLYFLTLRKPARIWWFIPYGLIAYAVMVITWPFLWEAPIGKFIQVVQFMSDNPTTLRVFFNGALYPANQLPLRYLPVLMLITLTEPVWPLAAFGFVVAALKQSKKGSPGVPWFLRWPGSPFPLFMCYCAGRRCTMASGISCSSYPHFCSGRDCVRPDFQLAAKNMAQVTITFALLLPGIIPESSCTRINIPITINLLAAPGKQRCATKPITG